MTTMDATELPNIAKAVNRWLSYQILCGREALLSEAYLVHKHSGQFGPKWITLSFAKLGPVAQNRFDYALFTRDAEAIEVAIECKWISTTPFIAVARMNVFLIITSYFRITFWTPKLISNS